MALYMDNFVEEQNGQLSFFSLSHNKEKEVDVKEQSFIKFVDKTHKKILKLMKLKEQYQEYEKKKLSDTERKKFIMDTEKVFRDFIDAYFEEFDTYDYDEILKYYEECSTDYHLVGKLFLFYLHTFVYKNNIIDEMNEPTFIRMENFVTSDPVSYNRDRECTYILEYEMKKRKKLRVDGYVLYYIDPVLKKIKCAEQNLLEIESAFHDLTVMVEQKKIGEIINSEIQKIRNDESLQEAIFAQGEEYIKKEQSAILAVFFLKYLEYCVYFDSFEKPNGMHRKFVSKVENYIIYHLNDSICLTKKQEKVFEVVKKQVAKRIGSYVEKEGNMFLEMLQDYDQIVAFQKRNQPKLIDASDEEEIEDLPNVYSAEEIQVKLEVFLRTVFVNASTSNKNRIPLFLEGLEEQKKLTLYLALVYLHRFVYSVSEDTRLEDKFVCLLEDFIISENFKVTEPSLCLAKSILQARSNARTLSNVTLARKILKSSTN